MNTLQPLSLTKNFSWTLFGRVFYAGSQWAMLVVLAKLTSPETTGEFVLGLAVTAPIIMFANMQLRLLQATDASEKFQPNDYLSLRLLAIGIALVCIGLIAYLGDFPGSVAGVIILVGIAKAIEAISDIFHGIFQRKERMDRLAWSQIIRGSLALLGLSIGITITHDLLLGIVGIIIAWVLGLSLYDIPVAQKISVVPGDKNTSQQVDLRPRWKMGNVKKLLLLGLPLGFVTLLRSLNVNIPRYFIEHYHGLYELGIFGGLVYVITAQRRLTQALGQAASPRLAQFFQSNDHHKSRQLLLSLVTIALVIGFLGFVITLIGGKQILLFLYNPEYADYESVFVLLAFTAIFDQTITILGFALTAARRVFIQVPLDLLNLSTLLVGCLFLIPKYGLTGAALALLMSRFIGLVSSSTAVWKISRTLKRSEPAEQPAHK